MKIVRVITVSIIFSMLIGVLWGPIREGRAMETYNINKSNDEVVLAPTPDQLIRFHVLANSDTEQDQALKRAVRDAILKEVSPKLAISMSLDESRQILKSVSSDMEDIGRLMVKSWGKDYTVHTEYGYFSFPTKSYGSLVLPAGNYEAIRVVIGEGQGSNWWCVLFPPLCFVDIDHSTAVQVDGKEGIPIKKDPIISPIKHKEESAVASPKVRFYFWELIKRIFHNRTILTEKNRI